MTESTPAQLLPRSSSLAEIQLSIGRKITVPLFLAIITTERDGYFGDATVTPRPKLTRADSKHIEGFNIAGLRAEGQGLSFKKPDGSASRCER
jgi:hypothetical protein